MSTEQEGGHTRGWSSVLYNLISFAATVPVRERAASVKKIIQQRADTHNIVSQGMVSVSQGMA
eukprot:1128314-Pyramimonas_sp.AAC.1